MRRSFLALLCATFGLFALSQGRTIYTSVLLTPKPGQAKALEAAIKSHTQKYHGKDKMNVFQIMSGPKFGSYQLVQGPYTWAALDSLKLGDAHNADFDENILTKASASSGSSFAQLHPELSHGSMNFKIEKSRVIVLDVKPGSYDSVIALVKKYKDALDKTNDERDMTTYTSMLSGSSSQVVLIYRYKNGWADQEMGHYPSMKDMFAKAFSESEYSDWIRKADANVESNQTHLRVFRKDLSSQ